MQTITLQLAISVATLVFSVLAAGVAFRGADVRFRPAWGLVALGFGMSGLSRLVQNSWGAWAFVSGPDSWIWDRYLHWAPAMNHGRIFLLLALSIVLIRLRPSRRPRSASEWVHVALGLLAAGLLGGVLGRWEGSFDPWGRHLMMLAAADLLWVVAYFSVLLVALRRNLFDWPLWTAILLYALAGAVDVLFLAAMSLGDWLGGWSPSTLQRNWIGLVRTLAAVGLALWAYLRARHGISSPGVGDSPRSIYRTISD